MSAPGRPDWKPLAARVDEVLNYIWDPLGVRGVPEARGEYDSYVLQVTGLLLRGASAGDLAEFLGRLTRDRMGLHESPRSAEGHRSTAELLVRWRERLDADRI